MLINLSIKDFLEKTAGSDPVPGGGSVSALCGSLSAALSKMVTNLTIGRKKYVDKEERMKELSEVFNSYLEKLTQAIDADSDAYNEVFGAFKLPKETEEEKEFRNNKIQEATKKAAEIPFSVAQNAYNMMDFIEETAKNGNQNAVTDACVAMMCARTAVLGALLNVRINLSSITDSGYVEQLALECNALEEKSITKEKELLDWVKTILNT
ncbi:cyclodeaminase/cyclohydrolase family protein [Bacteroidales bacterium OttesenSCG-928-A17]|nr:cyclodeaminase/cyclohydrolase family protein [Bacteroidales bacterium OttesenSCG-928-A17]